VHVHVLLFYLLGGIECLLLIPFILRFDILERGGRWAFYYLLSSIFFATGSYTVARIWHNNMWFFSIMYLIQFVILSVFFQIVLKNVVTKRVIVLLILPVFLIFLADFLKLEGIFTYNSYFATARTSILIIYGSLYFWQLLKDEELVQKSIFINSLPDFWFNAAFFINHCGSFMFYVAYNLLQQNTTHSAESKIAQNITLSISYIAGIIQLILLYIGLQKAKRRRHEYL